MSQHPLRKRNLITANSDQKEEVFLLAKEKDKVIIGIIRTLLKEEHH